MSAAPEGAARYLVTGANGFLGRHTVAALADAGHHVTALSRAGTPVPGAAEAVACDLLDREATAAILEATRPDRLIHLAWYADPRERWHTLANLDWLEATLALARAFAAAGGTRMVMGGSSAEYDWSGEAKLSETTSPLHPASLYGACKLAAGVALGAAAAKLGLRFAQARIFFCYGPGEPGGRLVQDLVAGFSERKRVACTDGLQQRDFLHAADIGRALAVLAASDVEGPINVASGEPVAVRDIVLALADLLDARECADLGAISRAADDPSCIYADVSRLRALGFTPRFDLASGLRDTVATWLAEAAAA